MKPSKMQRRVDAAFGRILSDRRFLFWPVMTDPETLDWQWWMGAPHFLDEAEARHVADRMQRQQWFRSDTYQVAMFEFECEQFNLILTHLSIKRNDRAPIDTMYWRELQAIKNAIVGAEREGVELFPAESRKVDGANQYHIFVLPPGTKWPFGFVDRMVTNDAGPGGAVQRPLAKEHM
jgi:hypothetical protein